MTNRLESVLEEYTQLGIQQQLDYDKFYLYSIITHSTAIEGSTITEIENQLLFDQGISANKPMTEQLMNLDLKSAYEQSFIYAKNHTDFSVELLCKIDKSDIQKIYELSFEAHYRIVSIHPWADGNGRMSRLVMNMIQYEAGVIPSIVKKESRAEYIQSLSISQDNDNSKQFILFMINHHSKNLMKQIEEYKASFESNDENGGQKKWSETTKKVFGLIKNNPHISRKELCEKLGINPSAVQKHIEKLKEQNMIVRIGGAKGGHWEIIK